MHEESYTSESQANNKLMYNSATPKNAEWCVYHACVHLYAGSDIVARANDVRELIKTRTPTTIFFFNF